MIFFIVIVLGLGLIANALGANDSISPEFGLNTIIGLLIIFKTFKILRSWKYKYTFSPFYYVFLMEIFPFKSSGSFFTSFGATIFFINYSFLIKSNIINEKK